MNPFFQFNDIDCLNAVRSAGLLGLDVPTTLQKTDRFLPELFGKMGVYFLFKGDDVVYVGQSKNILRRVGDHTETKDFDSFGYIVCPVLFGYDGPNIKEKQIASRQNSFCLDILESYYIDLLSPPLNKGRGGKNTRVMYFPELRDHLYKRCSDLVDGESCA